MARTRFSGPVASDHGFEMDASSLSAIAAELGYSSWDFVNRAAEAVTFPSQLAVARFSNAGTSPKWVGNSAGGISSVVAGQVAIDYDRGAWIEPSCINKIFTGDVTVTDAITFDGTNGWISVGSPTVTANISDPARGSNAYRLAGLTDAVFRFTGASGLASGRHEPSFYLRRVSVTGTLQILNWLASASQGDWRIDLSLLSDDWERITRDHPAVTIAHEFVSLSTSCAIGFSSIDSTSLTIEVFRPQLEPGAFSTSSVPTSGAAVTRAADRISVALADCGFSPTNNSLLVEAISRVASGTVRIFQTSDGTAANLIEVYLTDLVLTCRVIAGGVSQASFTFGSVSAGDPFRIAVAWSPTGVSAIVSGGGVTSHAVSTLPVVSTLYLGYNAATGVDQLNGYARKLKALPRMISGPELEEAVSGTFGPF